MATATAATLKTYFQTGDKPTQSNFTDLIDSSLNVTDGGTVAGTTTFTGAAVGVAAYEAIKALSSGKDD